MKEIKAYIRPERVTRVADALVNKMDMQDVTINPVEEVGRGKDPTQNHLSLISGKRCTDLVRLEVACTDLQVAPLVEMIRQKAHTASKAMGRLKGCRGMHSV